MRPTPYPVGRKTAEVILAPADMRFAAHHTRRRAIVSFPTRSIELEMKTRVGTTPGFIVAPKTLLENQVEVSAGRKT
jgi:hypothetical protein